MSNKKIIPVNFYEKCKNYEGGKIRSYKNHHLTNLDLEARCILCGGSGGKKTNTLINIIKDTAGAFSHYYIYAHNLNQPLYHYLEDNLSDIPDCLTMTEDLTEIPDDLSDFEKESLIVFDDCQTQNKKTLKKIENIYCNSRSRGLSAVWIGQSYFKIPQAIRENTDYIFFKRVKSNKALKRMTAEYFEDDEERERFMNAYHEMLKNDNNWVLIDCKTNNAKLKIRLNYDPI